MGVPGAHVGAVIARFLRTYHMHSRRCVVTVAFLISSFALIALAQAPKKWEYPKTHTVDAVDDYHGTKVPDPYRWLEDVDSDDVRAFVDAENALARKFLDGPVREQIKTRVTQLLDYPKYSTPTPRS